MSGSIAFQTFAQQWDNNNKDKKRNYATYFYF